MYGDFVGKLYVWLIDAVNVKEPLLVFVKEGNQGAMWRRAIISSPEDGVNWKVIFNIYMQKLFIQLAISSCSYSRIQTFFQRNISGVLLFFA